MDRAARPARGNVGRRTRRAWCVIQTHRVARGIGDRKVKCLSLGSYGDAGTNLISRLLAVAVLSVPRQDRLITAVVDLKMDRPTPEIADVFKDLLGVAQIEVASLP